MTCLPYVRLQGERHKPATRVERVRQDATSLEDRRENACGARHSIWNALSDESKIEGLKTWGSIRALV